MMALFREWLRLEGTSEGLRQPLPQSRLLRAMVQSGSEYLQGYYHKSSGQPIPVLITLRITFFILSKWTFFYFILCPLPLVLSLGTTDRTT